MADLPAPSPCHPTGTLPARLAVHAGNLLIIALAALTPAAAAAHEAWLLTPEEVLALNAEPKPELFTHLSLTNVAMMSLAAVAVVGWVLVASSPVQARLVAIFSRLAALERYTPLIVRCCIGLTLVMAAMGLHPRHGTGLLEAATLGLPDLELRLLGTSWSWLAGLELAVAALLLIGVQVRLAAAATLLLTVLGLLLFRDAMLAYAGALAGAAAYLLLHRPCRERALFLVRALTGATFLYCGICYKLLQPNLALAIIVCGEVPTFGLGAEPFVFGMALVEVLAGALMMTGLLVQPLVVLLFVPFLFFTAVLGENPLGHVLFYGNLFALAAGGAGSWAAATAGAPHGRAATLTIAQ